LTAKTSRKITSLPPFVREENPNVEIEPIVEPIYEVERSADPLAWLTLETLLYGLLFVLALSLRLWHLDLYPLSDAEAAQSWPALQLYRGNPLDSVGYSPLLVTLNGLIFLFLGASDATARFAPALLGSLIVMLPVTLRRQLGPRVCLLAGALLAFSPTALFFSRTLNSEIGLMAGTLLAVAGFFNWTEEGQQRWLLLAAVGLALLLSAGPLVYSVLIVFGVIILIKFSAFKALWLRGLDQMEDKPILSQEVEAETEHSNIALEPVSDDDHASPPHPLSTIHHPPSSIFPSSLRRAGLFFLVSLVLLATAGLFNISGLSMVSGFLPDWLSRFSFQGRPDAAFNAVFLLTIYEPLLVLAGLAGLAYTFLEKDVLKQTLGGWFIGLMIMDMVMIGRPNGSVVLTLTPLDFLAALALAELWQSLSMEGSWGNEGLLFAAGLVISAFSYIGLTGWLIRTCDPADTICQYAWLQPIAALGLFIIIAIFFSFMTNAGAAARGVALTGVAIGLLAAINIGWRLNFGPLMDLAYQPLAGIPASTGLEALNDTLTRQAEERTGGQKTALDTTLAGVNSPALLWQLRDFDQLTQVNSVAEATPTMAIITPPEVELGMEQPYLGQSFTLDAVWSPVGLPAKDLVNWLLYRHIAAPPTGSQVILWLRLDQD
jgi:uncharacterized protein (TIGR03663 family)